jgi:hypothetical protein
LYKGSILIASLGTPACIRASVTCWAEFASAVDMVTKAELKKEEDEVVFNLMLFNALKGEISGKNNPLDDMPSSLPCNVLDNEALSFEKIGLDLLILVVVEVVASANLE